MADGKAVQDGEVPSNSSSALLQGLARERDKSFVRSSGPIQKKDDIVEDVVRAAAAGFGFISEAVHHHRDKKTKAADVNAQHPSQPLETQKPDSQQLNEAIWNIDDAEQEVTTDQKKAPKPSKDPVELAKAFLQRHPGQTEPNSESQGMLALPVVLPQRRPEQRSRGFVRAYAPVLANSGVDQRAFLDFVDAFNKSLEPNPWINALNLAGFADLPIPEPATLLFGIAVDLAVEAALEANSRVRSRNFLDYVNAEFFLPRGLVCLVATWKPDSAYEEVTVGFDGKETAPSTNATDFRKSLRSILAQQTSTDEELLTLQKRMQDKMRSSQGMVGWSEPAPLVFPTIDELAASEARHGNGEKKGVMDRADQWIEEYTDKRAQIKWKDSNPDHPVASSLPRAEFRSRYADPSHPAASGDVVALVTGGRWQYQSKKKEAKKETKKEAKKEAEKKADDSSKVEPSELASTESRARDSVELPAESSIAEGTTNDKPLQEGTNEGTTALRGSTGTNPEPTGSSLTTSTKESTTMKDSPYTSDADSKSSGRAGTKKATTTAEDDQILKKEDKTDSKLKAEQKAAKKKRAKEEEEEKRQAKKMEAQEKKAKEKEAKERKAREKEAKEKDAKEKKAREKEERENEKKERRAKEKEEKERKASEKKAAPSPENIVKGLFQKDVLYLIIVNAPRREDVNAVANEEGSAVIGNTPAE